MSGSYKRRLRSVFAAAALCAPAFLMTGSTVPSSYIPDPPFATLSADTVFIPEPPSSLSAMWARATMRADDWDKDAFFTNPETGDLVRYRYAPPHGQKRGAVVLTGGYGESIDLYYELTKDYQDRGFAVWAMDWHGQGLSGRDDDARPDMPSARSLLRHRDDLHFFMTNIVKKSESMPVIYSTNSMGGHIGMLYLQAYPHMFDGAVFSTPLYGLKQEKMPASLKFLLYTDLIPASWKGRTLPCEPAAVDKYNDGSRALDDPDLAPATLRRKAFNYMARRQPQLGLPTYGWLSAYNGTRETILDPARLRVIKTPLLIGSAEHETLVDNRQHRIIARTVADGQHVYIRDGWHNLWFQAGESRAIWMDKVDGFLKRVIKGIESRTLASDSSLRSGPSS